ncbi:MAG: rhodanese-like domain-containing protein [Armatimonadetes bacterium]|nr:rhodanese-like domain-containing protein [Armatimonadota bacterium]
MREITVEELKARRDNGEEVFVLDVRDQDEYELCNIGGCLIPLDELPNRLEELDRAQEIVVHCRRGGRATKAVACLEEAGFQNVKKLQGGIRAWAERIDPEVPVY